MSRRLPSTPAPGPLEEYCAQFDLLLARRSQRDSFRRYLEGILLAQERNKTLTALANAEPIMGAQKAPVQTLQWFLSESEWSPVRLNECRQQLLFADPLIAPHGQGVLVIDETGDRKDGHKTAHVGRQYLANLGKIDNGVVSVTSLFADGKVYYPLDVEPYTPASWFEKGKSDPAFRTKPQIAWQLVQQAQKMGLPFRAVVADSVYGEHDEFKACLNQGAAGFVLAVRPSHTWWHREGTLGSLWEAAEVAAWEGSERPGAWQKVVRRFADGHTEDWWALECEAGPYGVDHPTRAIVASTDPAHLPVLSTWCLLSNLPAPGSSRSASSPLAPADVDEVVRLYGLRQWVEQSYKQVKHALGWAQYQVRSDQAIRRHWALVCCAFSFCWWHQSHNQSCSHNADPAPARHEELVLEMEVSERAETEEKKGADRGKCRPAELACGSSGGAILAGAGDPVVALLAGVVGSAPTAATPIVAGTRVAGTGPLSL